MPPLPPGAAPAVLFDLDDTLVPWQTVPHWQWAWRPRGPVLSERRVLAAIHRSLHAWDRRRWQGLVGETPPADLAAHRQHLVATLHAIAGHPLPTEETEAVVNRFLRPAGEIEAFADVRPCLGRLAQEGIRIGAVTALPAEAAQHALRRAGLADVSLLQTGESPLPGLPAPGAFRAAAQSLGHKPAEILYVGDLFWSDVRAAARVGFRTVLLDRREWAARVLARRIRSLSEVPDLALHPPAETAPTEPDGPGPEASPPGGPGPSDGTP